MGAVDAVVLVPVPDPVLLAVVAPLLEVTPIQTVRLAVLLRLAKRAVLQLPDNQVFQAKSSSNLTL